MSNKTQNYTYPLAILTILFFVWGFITALNDVLIPYLKKAFDLDYTQSLQVQFAFFGAYFVGSFFYFLISSASGDPIAKIGYKNGLIIGLLTSAVGCGLFYPAAELEIYAFFLGALFTLGLGLTLLQISANPYVTLLGKPETASSRLNLSQGFNSLGTTIAPSLGGFLIFDYFFSDAEGVTAVKPVYVFLAITFVLLAVMIRFAKLPKMVNSGSGAVKKGTPALRYKNLVFGIIAIFCYVGAEVAIGSLLINFMGLGEIMGLEEAEASNFLSLYWGGAMIGRFIGTISMSNQGSWSKKILLMVAVSAALYFIVTLVSTLSFQETLPILGFVAVNLVLSVISKGMPERTLAVFALVAVALLIVGVVQQGEVAMWAILAIGLFNSIMFSNIFALSVSGLGEDTSQGSSLLVMAIVGGALIPQLQAFVADKYDLQISFLIPVVCYFYLAFFGFVGYKPKKFS